MYQVCEICGKEPVIGSSQKHRRGVAGKRWKKKTTKTSRTFSPNLQKKTLLVSGKEVKLRLCAKCIKRIKKYKSIKDYKNVTLL